jgi:hypothetical protein
MSKIHTAIINNLPLWNKTSQLGWRQGNSICCHHRGHRQDTRQRGNILFASDGIIAYNCYNCGFKTKFDNISLSNNFELLLKWLNVSNEDINIIKLELLENKLNGINRTVDNNSIIFTNEFNEIDLPENSISVNTILNSNDISVQFNNVYSYLSSRGNTILTGWNYYWCNSTKHNLNKRIIIPFYEKNKIVGWTARYAGTPPNKNIPKYYNSEIQQGYLFNYNILNNQHRKFILISEGPFDAIAVEGIATLGSELSNMQISMLNNTSVTKIVVPDRQRKNQGLIDAALENNWYVSFPEWEDNIKDAADASCRYGKLFTIKSILEFRTNSKLQIGIKRKMFKN